MMPGMTAGDGWSLDGGDTRGDTANHSATGGMGGSVTINKGGAMSAPMMIGLAAVLLGGFYMMTKR